MCLNYVAQKWPMNFDNPEAIVKYHFDEQERRDVEALLRTPVLNLYPDLERYRELQLRAYRLGRFEEAGKYYDMLRAGFIKEGLI